MGGWLTVPAKARKGGSKKEKFKLALLDKAEKVKSHEFSKVLEVEDTYLCS